MFLPRFAIVEQRSEPVKSPMTELEQILLAVSLTPNAR
jgi:hypothetical protein